MGNREIVARECDRANMVRRVCMASVDDRTFFHEISGPLMISGLPAGEITLVGDLICEYAARNDMPTVVLTGRPEILGYLSNIVGAQIEVNSIADMNKAFEMDIHKMMGKTVMIWKK